MTEGSVQTIHCPNCNNEIIVTANYVTWCDKCNWNILPIKEDEKRSRFENLTDRIGKKQSRVIFDDLAKTGNIQSKNAFVDVIGIFISLLVHSLTLGILGLGVYIIVKNWPSAVAIFWGLMLLAIAYVLRPRLKRKSKDQLSRNEFPLINHLVDEIASQFGVKISSVTVDGEYNAKMSSVGILQKNELVLGLPLIFSLEDQEVVALLSHEIAHAGNRDSFKSVIIGNALNSLEKWNYLLHPGVVFCADSLGDILIIPFKLIEYLIAQFFYGIYFLLFSLFFRKNQIAEYKADYRAAEIAGRNAILSLLHKLKYANCYQIAVKNCALASDRKVDLYQEIEDLMKGLPDNEIKRVERMGELFETRIDSSHPPTVYRERNILRHTFDVPQMGANKYNFSGIREELAKKKDEIQTCVIDDYRSSINRMSKK